MYYFVLSFFPFLKWNIPSPNSKAKRCFGSAQICQKRHTISHSPFLFFIYSCFLSSFLLSNSTSKKKSKKHRKLTAGIMRDVNDILCLLLRIFCNSVFGRILTLKMVPIHEFTCKFNFKEILLKRFRVWRPFERKSEMFIYSLISANQRERLAIKPMTEEQV